MIVHDLRCEACDVITPRVLVEAGRYPNCPTCGGTRTWVPAGFATDVYGCAQFSDATGRWHTSQRDKRRTLRELGYHEAGDPVHGARPELRIRNTGFSYPGQGSRVSTQERAQQRPAK